MLGYPPIPIPTLPYEDGFNPEDWIAQPKYKGWKIIIHENRVYTHRGKLLPVKVGYPKTEFDYQLDGKIFNPSHQQKQKVATAIKHWTYKLEILDVYLPFAEEMILVDRVEFLKRELGIFAPCFSISCYSDITRKVEECQRYGLGGIILKKKNSTYGISEHCCMMDRNWIKVE